uniref:DM2 domain-containing protein n=2 Tax=Opuntia streptacantha TaxID=393608 RepID=A0A7C9D1Q2_OPUST
MATTAWRAIGGKCRVLLMAAKSSAAAAATTTPTAAASKAAKPAKPRTPSAASVVPKVKGILKRVPVSPTLGEFLGASEASRTDAVKKIWEYIRTQGLQNPSNKREIICDEKLKTLFGKDKVGFLEIARLLSQHFVKTG